MNEEQQRKINETLTQVRISNRSGSHIGCIRLNVSAGIDHNREIIRRCYEYLTLGIPFMTEAIFLNGSRCDILLPITNEIIEISHSESEKRFKVKQYKYPEIFTIRQVRV